MALFMWSIRLRRGILLHHNMMNKPLIISCLALTFPCASLLWAQTAAAPAAKPTCAVLTFDAMEGVMPGECKILSNRFRAELNRLGAYRLLSREKMSEILKTRAFSRSENCSVAECAIEAGKMLRVDHMIYGSVGKIGTLYSLNAYAVDVKSGETVKSATVDQPDEFEKALEIGVGALARRLLGIETAEPVAATSPEPVASSDTALPSGERQRTDRELTVDLGNGGKMEFVWIEALKGWVGKYEVTNGEYRRFKPEHNSGEYSGHSLNGDRQPVVMVRHDDAVAFAEWLNRTAQLPSEYRARLPDGNAWMTFAQCGDGRRYPWGNERTPKYGNYADHAAKGNFAGWPVINEYNDGADVTCRVEQSGKNDWGLYGVGGNVWEWTSELSGDWRGMRGASWTDYDPGNLECARCNHRYFEIGYNFVGFRLLLSR